MISRDVGRPGTGDARASLFRGAAPCGRNPPPAGSAAEASRGSHPRKPAKPGRRRSRAPRGHRPEVHMRIGPGLKPLRKGEKLAILMPGMGAVATTAIAGVEAVKKKLAAP